MLAIPLPAGRSFEQGSALLMTYATAIHALLDRGRLAIAGVGRDRFTYVYRGVGRVFGVKFRPGAFLPFLGAPVATITVSRPPARRCSRAAR